MEIQEKLVTEILQKMMRLDFAHLAILNVHVAEHMHNILQQAEINRLKEKEKDNVEYRQ